MIWSRTFLVTSLCLILFGAHVSAAHAAPIVYDFESDTIGQTPANTTVGAGTFEVFDDTLMGKSLRAVTQQGVIAAINFDAFTGSNNQSVVWKQSYSDTTARAGFTLRAQPQDTNVVNSAGAKLGYLFHVYENNAVYIWRVDPGTYTPLWSGSLAKAEPRWFKASAVGTQLEFAYSNNGTDYTTLGTASDATYTSGNVQYTAGYGASVGQEYVDDIVITNLDIPYVENITTTTPDGFYNDGDTITINVQFSQPVDVTGNPFLNLNTGGIANYVAGSGTDTLTFEYVVFFSVNTADLDVVQINLNVTGTIIDSTNGNNAELAIPDGYNLADTADIVIDNTDPEIVSATITDTHEVTVVYSEIVTNHTSSSYTNFGGSLAGRTIVGQSGNINTNSIVLVFDGASLEGLGDGSFDIAADIVDRAGNTFAGATGVVVDELVAPNDGIAPVMTLVAGIPTQVLLEDAVLQFSISEICNIQATQPTSTTGDVTLFVEQPQVGQTMQAALEGMQVGGTYSFSISCVDEDDNESNTLATGYFTIVSNQSSRSRVIGGYARSFTQPRQETQPTTPTTNQCPAGQILTQNLRTGARNGRFHPYTRGVVTEANILQAHLNRLGFNSGPVDGILGPISDGAIKRMQTFLGTTPDGFVGPITRGLLNASCGSAGLLQS